MKAEWLTLVAALAACAFQAAAQESPPVARASTNTAVPAPVEATTWLTLSNETIAVIAKVRGVKPELVRLEAKSNSTIGPFEVDLTSATNCAIEAEILSSKLGTNVIVVLEEASHDGQMRTNQTFRNGIVRKIVAPSGQKPLSPGDRRMVVWPDGTRPGVPTQFRIAK